MRRHEERGMRQDDDEYEDEPYVIIERSGPGLGTFLIGMALGAGAALLFAPQSGEATRRGLQLRARRARDMAQDAAEGIGDSLVDRYEHARRSVEEGLDSARVALEVKRRQAAEAIRAGREAAQQAREELEARIAETKAAYQAGAGVARANAAAQTGAPAVPPLAARKYDDEHDPDAG